MVNITHKTNSWRQAIASAIVQVSNPKTIEAIINKKVPKGDPFECSRAAGLLAIKKTSDMIPDCHPLPVEYANIQYRIVERSIIIEVEVQTIYKTGVEVEAMHGAAITALTIYDMLKPIDPHVEITSIRLLRKKGGKTDLKSSIAGNTTAAVIVCSDSVTAGKEEDLSGKAIIEKLKKFEIQNPQYHIIPDEISAIQRIARELSEKQIQLALFTGGTGLSPRDHTPEALSPLIEREIPGIMETARAYGQERSPYAMLSRGLAGFIKNTLFIAMPGSIRGTEETMDALFPQILHVFQLKDDFKHKE